MKVTLLISTMLTAALLGTGCGGTDATTSFTAVTEKKENSERVVRGCDARVGDSRHKANPQDIVLGNARLAYAHENAPVRMGGVFDSGKRQTGKWRAFKTLVVLNGAEATLRVPRSARADFLLAYDPAHIRNFAYFRSDGQGAVRFVNCSPPRRNLEFAGSLLVRRPGCYPVQEVSREGEVVASTVVNIAMGRGACDGDSTQSLALGACTPTAARRAFAEFVTAYNRGDLRKLDSLFARQPAFDWYSSNAPGPRLNRAAARRDTLIAYFRNRHLEQDRLRPVEIDVITAAPHLTGLSILELRRRAADYGGGRWFSVAGKAGLTCHDGRARFLVVSLGTPRSGSDAMAGAMRG